MGLADEPKVTDERRAAGQRKPAAVSYHDLWIDQAKAELEVEIALGQEKSAERERPGVAEQTLGATRADFQDAIEQSLNDPVIADRLRAQVDKADRASKLISNWSFR
jgi:hypothetical protein